MYEPTALYFFRSTEKAQRINLHKSTDRRLFLEEKSIQWTNTLCFLYMQRETTAGTINLRTGGYMFMANEWIVGWMDGRRDGCMEG